jgi:hypothetical protein
MTHHETHAGRLGIQGTMPVAITGMHRSGTSLVSKLLHLSGLYLGQERDLLRANAFNQDGYWENTKFVELNDELLNELGGAWDCPPPLAEGWIEGKQFRAIEAKARVMLQEFVGHEPWGWKDPRNSLTIPFWKKLFPALKVVICLRNPLEVSLSLHRRNDISHALALCLWKDYSQRIIDAIPPSHRIITHYDAHFQNPQAELHRVLLFLNMPLAGDLISQCCASTRTDLRHECFTIRNLLDVDASPAVVDLYARMCAEAGWLDDGAVHSPLGVKASAWSSGSAPQPPGGEADPSAHSEEPSISGPESPDDPLKRRGLLRGFGRLDTAALSRELLQREVKVLKPRLAEHEAKITELQASLKEKDAIGGEVAELRRRLAELGEREAALQSGLEERGRQNEALQGEYDSARRELDELRQQIRENEVLQGEYDSARRELDELRQLVVEQTEWQPQLQQLEEEHAATRRQVADLRQILDHASASEKELREMLLDAHDQLLRRDEELRAAVTELQRTEATRQEVAAFRQAVIERLEVCRINPDPDDLVGYSLDSPGPGGLTDLDEIRVDGWVLGRSAPAVAVELKSAGAVLRHVPIRISRPDVAANHASVAGAEFCGFQTTLRVLELASHSDISVLAVLRDDRRVPIAVLRSKQVAPAQNDNEPEIAKLRQSLNQATIREQEMREMLLDAHDQLLRRDEELQAIAVENVLANGQPVRIDAPQLTGGSLSLKQAQYRKLVQQIREVVESTLPAGANVIVVSRGDSDLLQLAERRGWHFPQLENGVYAGYHPPDSGAAIAHLEELRSRGADFLLFPSTAFWWLDHYEEFRQHLERQYPTVRNDEICRIFALHEPAAQQREGDSLVSSTAAARPEPGSGAPQTGRLWRLFQPLRHSRSPHERANVQSN